MTLTRAQIVIAHGLAVVAIAAGLWAWDAQGAHIWRDGIFAFCV